jgi:hypothetical protein
MKLTAEQIAFIEEHFQEDTTRLLLNASRYPDMDLPFLVEQITARRRIREKLPVWAANKGLVIPAKIAAEQCSSELTAGYKQRLIRENDRVCDLTGGLGVDSFYFSQKAEKVTYIERFESYADAARTNFELLGAENIAVYQGNGEEVSKTIDDVSVFYLDPARRGEGNKRVFALSDCEPDLTVLCPTLLRRAPKVIAKISPMADIRNTLHLLPQTTEVHVVAVKNECKELLFVMEGGVQHLSAKIVCAQLSPGEEPVCFCFTLEEEQTVLPNYTDRVEHYLYEPNVALLKAGAFKVITERYPLKKLHVNSHLYTSDRLVADFPGRTFVVEEVLPFSAALCKKIVKTYPKANITARNFPLTVEALRKKTKIQDGGDIYLFATTLANEDKVLIRTRKWTDEHLSR